MAKQRMVNTRFWNDSFISHLDPIEKLLFIYFLTNEHTNICGIYELPLKIAAIETGIDATMFEKIIPRLKPKIFFTEDYVIIPNFMKYQASDNPKVQKGAWIALNELPSHILEQAIGYGYPIDTLPMYSNSNSNSKDNELGLPNSPTFQKTDIDSDGNPIAPKKKKDPIFEKQFREMVDLLAPVNKTYKSLIIRPAERKHAKVLLDTIGFDNVVKWIKHLPETNVLDGFPKITSISQLSINYNWLKEKYNARKSS